MKNIISKYKIDGVWHFTDRSNIALIEQHGGLLSLAELERKCVDIPVPGGNQWSHDADKMVGLHKYVHLAFLDNHPMLYRARQDGRINDPIWLKIDVSILLDDEVLFCADVSNKAGVPTFDATQAIREVDFDVLFTYMDWRSADIQQRRQAAIKSEILVPNIVPIDKILDYKNG
jgi:ssDNA thymidine ADP-ribosyltransferase, DarT